MSRLDNSLDSPCDRVFISSARGCQTVLSSSSSSSSSTNSNNNNKFSLIITAAKSLCPKNPTLEEQEMTLQVVNDDSCSTSSTTTEEDCDKFFERMIEKFEAEKEEKTGKVSRIYIALDDNASQNLKPVILPFAKFLKKYLSVFVDDDEKNQKKNCVLVHCVLGRSRSVALVASYMMFVNFSSSSPPRLLCDVMDDIRKVRSIAEVNPVFGAQLFAIWRREMMKYQQQQQQKEER